MVRLLLAFIFLSSFAFADYEIHYIVKSRDKKAVGYATLYYDQRFWNEDVVKDGIKGQWGASVIFAICDEPGANCNRDNEKKKITKVVPYADYLAKLGEIFKVEKKYFAVADGMARIEKDMRSAQQQGDSELYYKLAQQREALPSIYRIAGSIKTPKPTKEEPGTKTHQLLRDHQDFKPALAPMFLAKEYNTPNVEGRFFDVFTLGEWVLAEKNAVDYPTAEEKCKSLDGTLPTNQDIYILSSVLPQSPIAKWADKFWVFNEVGTTQIYRNEKVNTGENSYRNVPYYDFSSKIQFAQIIKGIATVGQENISLGSVEVSYTSNNRPAYAPADIYAKSKTKASVICKVKRD